ncbi:hypothetical protein [Armatimonas sp.]|jgi:hypothetical protein|nr:hypothetical protein [Armatimonas sp.]
MPPPKKPKFEVTPVVMLGCGVAMFAWMFLMGFIMLGLKMSAGSQ